MTKALISLRVKLIATCLDSIILYSIIHTNYKWMHEWFTLFEIDKKYIQSIYNDGHNILILYQISFSPQVKRRVIISNKHGTYELPHELPNDIRLRILGN